MLESSLYIIRTQYSASIISHYALSSLSYLISLLVSLPSAEFYEFTIEVNHRPAHTKEAHTSHAVIAARHHPEPCHYALLLTPLAFHSGSLPHER